MFRILTLSLILAIANGNTYIPGTPGAAWTMEEVLAVKAKLRFTLGKPKDMVTHAQELGSHIP